MKKKQVLLAVFAATMLTPTVAWAQYPQITGEAKENYTKMMTEERKRSDEAWAKALPIVQKEAKEGRPYIPWAGRPYDLPQADIPSFISARRNPGHGASDLFPEISITPSSENFFV